MNPAANVYPPPILCWRTPDLDIVLQHPFFLMLIGTTRIHLASSSAISIPGRSDSRLNSHGTTGLWEPADMPSLVAGGGEQMGPVWLFIFFLIFSSSSLNHARMYLAGAYTHIMNPFEVAVQCFYGILSRNRPTNKQTTQPPNRRVRMYKTRQPSFHKRLIHAANKAEGKRAGLVAKDLAARSP